MTDKVGFSTEEIPQHGLSKQVNALTAEVSELKEQLNNVENNIKDLHNIVNKLVDRLE